MRIASRLSGPSIRVALLGLLLVAIIPYLAIIGFQTATRHAADLDRADETARVFARHTASRTEQFLSDSRGVLERMAQRPLIQAVDASRCDPFMSDYLALHPRIANVGVVDRTGHVICSAMPQPGGNPASVLKTGWFRAADATNSFVVGEPFVGPITGRWVSVLAQPIQRDGRLVGILAMPIDLVVYGRLIETVDLPPDAIVTIVDEGGVVVASSQASAEVGRPMPDGDFDRIAGAGATGTFQATDADGIERLHAYATVAGTGWRVIAGLSPRPILGPAKTTNLTSLLVAIAGTLLVAWIGLHVGRRIADPIERLGAAARRQGDRTGAAAVDDVTPIEPAGPKEVREAITGFNDMSSRRAAAERDLSAQTIAATTARRTLEEILDATPLSVILCDLDGTVRFWGGAAESMFGWTSEEAVGRVLPDAPLEEASSSADLRARIGAGNVVRDEPAVRLHRDGRAIQVAFHAAPRRDADGAVIGIVALAVDMADRIAAENARLDLEVRLARSQKLDAVGQLAGGIAHDFNNLLTAIGGYTDLLGSSQSLSATDQADVVEIRGAADRARTLTSQLMAFSRGQVRTPTPVNLGAVVNAIEPLLRRLIGEHIELRTEGPDRPWSVLADVSQVEQIIVNLAVNARDAMPYGGILSIRVLNEPGSDATGGARRRSRDRVVLEVRDDGMGMDDSVREHLFEPFFTTKPVGKGTGLGLATVHGIVEQAGGAIAVDSRPGSGTAFTISLPRVRRSALTRVAEQHLPLDDGLALATVLLVEDDEQVRRLLGRVLAEAGFDVIEASNGEEAAAIVSGDDDTIEIVVTDLVMPGLGGRGLADRVGHVRPDLPFVFMSGYTEEDIGDLTNRPRATFLAKPLTPVDLVGEVRRLLGTSPPPRL